VGRRTSFLFELLLAGLAIGAAVPLFLVAHPPLQDLPQHLAAIRVFADYDDPSFRFSEFFTSELGRTQYLAYYLATRALTPIFGIELANRLILSAAIIGTPYTLRALLRALGRPKWLCLFVLPLTWNAHLILGFMNFIAAIPLMLIGLAIAAHLRLEPTRTRAIALAAVALLAFYTHVVPFGFLALGAAIVGVGDGIGATMRRWMPLVPAGIATLAWMFTSPAGEATRTAAHLTGGSGNATPQFASVSESLASLPLWLTDAFTSNVDEALLVTWGAMVLITMTLGIGEGRDPDEPTDPRAMVLARRLGLLAPIAFLAYFVCPTSYDWIWPIAPRFPLLAAVFLPIALPAPRAPRATAFVVLALTMVCVIGFRDVSSAFLAFEHEEVGEMEEAISHVPKGSRVVALVFDKGSRHVKFAPFLHAAAWVQLRRGGATMFTFADFPQSPIRFREENRPPRVPPRWEWMPERIDPERDLGWYDVVVVRGGPGRMRTESGAFVAAFESRRWSVWKRAEAR
jgi:hypothetical protein